MYKQYLALNNQEWLICHKIKPKQFSIVFMMKYLRYFEHLQTFYVDQRVKVLAIFW